jgi:hypothetical protein
VRGYHYDRSPSLEYVARVAEVFGYRLEWLAGGDGPPTQEEARRLLAALASSPEPPEEHRAFFAQVDQAILAHLGPLHPSARLVFIDLLNGLRWAPHPGAKVEGQVSADEFARALAAPLKVLSHVDGPPPFPSEAVTRYVVGVGPALARSIVDVLARGGWSSGNRGPNSQPEE